MQKVVWGLVLLLIILHQDFWFWTDERLIFGVVPIGLAWHIGISIGASLTWLLAINYAWPADEAEAVEPAKPRANGGGAV